MILRSKTILYTPEYSLINMLKNELLEIALYYPYKLKTKIAHYDSF